MAYKEKSQAISYNNAYNKEHYDRVNLMLPKGKKEEIQLCVKAKSSGESVTAFILRAINKLLEEEQP